MTDPTNYRTNRDLFSNYYLNDHLRNTEPWTEPSDAEVESAFAEIKSILVEKGDRVEDYNEAQLERNVIRPIFDILEIPYEIEETVMRNARRPDYGFFPSNEAADAAFDREDFYEESIAVADAKRWGRKLDTRGDEKRDFENPSYQIHRYLQETSPEWAILTNGEKWRLYYGPTSHRLDSFYEINLPTLLEIVEEDDDLEAFKEFYLFFRQEAFLPDQSGDCFLDEVYDESSIFAEELGEDLQENIYEAIRVLAEGFLDTNDGLDEGDLDRIHDSSLIYLYRLIFVLYAESEGRNLLPTDNDIYAESYSLNELKQTVVSKRDETQQHYQAWQTDLWDWLDQLFVLIDEGSQGQGIPKDDLYIPAYNGGLFRTQPDDDDSVESQFLASHEAGDAYIAEVIELLTRHEASEGDGKVFVDYSSLDERNLGSIYEGLLEYKLDVADEPLTVDDGEYSPAGEDDSVTVEEGDVYLRTDDGERKATGSYYTPEYVVEYIVDETLGPLVKEIREDMLAESARGDERGFAEEFADRVFDLTVLDPAMGSGHFPVNAVDYLAREIIDAQEQQDRQALDSADAEVRAPTTEDGELRDINWARRKVAQRCIYGVDVNPLATELAKVSLWLRPLAAEQPLAFLDHHLKTGNSLVGSDIENVLSDGDDEETEDGQLTLQQSFDHTRQRAMEHVTDRFQDLLNIDNETLEDAKEMEAVYDDVRDDPLYKKLLAMANVHTAEAFGLDIPDDADERMARALHSDAWEKIEQQDWFKSAQAMAEDERFFHWELEFPIAFYDQEGERKVDAGFDAVIGNPPWVNAWEMTESGGEAIREKIAVSSSNPKLLSGHWDLYVPFVIRGFSLIKQRGSFGYIIPNAVCREKYATDLREYLLQEADIRTITPFGEENVFEGVSRQTVVPIMTKGEPNANKTYIDRQFLEDKRKSQKVDQSLFLDMPGSQWRYDSKIDEINILKKVESKSIRVGDAFYVNYGVQASSEEKGGFKKEDVLSEDPENGVEFFEGKNIHRYYIERPGLYLDYQPDAMYGPRHPSLFEANKIAIRYVSGSGDTLRVAYDESGMYTDHLVVLCTKYENVDEEQLQSDFEGFGRTSYDYDTKSIQSVLASKLVGFYYAQRFATGSLQGSYSHVYPQSVRSFPIPENDGGTSSLDIDGWIKDFEQMLGGGPSPRTAFSDWSSTENVLSHLTDEIIKCKNNRKSINLKLLDYLGNYEEGPKLPDIGFYHPTSENILDSTTEDYEKLQIERSRTKRENTTVTIEVTARYKPENKDEFETDSYDYTETDFFEAFTLTNLNEQEAALVEAFVPVAVDKEVGGFRDNATKTNSLIDRLKGMTLPDPDDVADDLRRYIETKERADELEEKIEKTDQLIDEIVYDFYDLTDEEIEIVEEAVADD